jgi:hypothetical protein
LRYSKHGTGYIEPKYEAVETETIVETAQTVKGRWKL